MTICPLQGSAEGRTEQPALGQSPSISDPVGTAEPYRFHSPTSGLGTTELRAHRPVRCDPVVNPIAQLAIVALEVTLDLR